MHCGGLAENISTLSWFPLSFEILCQKNMSERSWEISCNILFDICEEQKWISSCSIS